MSDDSSEKHYDATPSRIQRAKREGNVARSQDAVSVAAFCGAIVAMIAVVSPLSNAFATSVRSAARNAIDGHAFALVALLASAPIAAAAACAVTCGVLQSGGVNAVAPSLKLERLSPADGLKRMFSREALVTAARAILAFAAATAVIVPAVATVVALAVRSHSFAASIAAAWSGAARVAFTACAVGAVFAGLDFAVVRAAWLKKLRMSFDDLKRDVKENDGDPQLRARRRSLHRELSKEAITRVKDAAFVLTNPAHIAIALEYRPPDVPVPRVLLRAADESARKIRALAHECGVPCIENVPLARGLFSATKPGDVIPQDYYVAVAEVVAALVKAGALA